MSKNQSIEKAIEASVKAVDQAKIELEKEFGEELANKIGKTIEISTSDEDMPKYTVVKGVRMQQYGGAFVKANGILDETETVLAAAIARPGSAEYGVRGQNNLSRTIMYGDVTIFAFNSAEKKVGMRIMPTKSWMIIQAKNAAGEERIPFIKTPWDVKQQIVSQTGSLQAPSLDRQIKILADIAINLAATECLKRIEDNKPSQVQESYNTAIQASAVMASIISNRKSGGSSINQLTGNGGELSSATADLLSD